jgi:hypothetical protein
MSLRDIWRASWLDASAKSVAAGAAFRADVAARLDDAREEREARIRAEAYAQGRQAGIAVERERNATFFERANKLTEKNGVSYVRNTADEIAPRVVAFTCPEHRPGHSHLGCVFNAGHPGPHESIGRPGDGWTTPCPGGRHSWDADATWCDCGALERI